MKPIFICGAYRSGSTWSFNVVREFAKHKNITISQEASPDFSILQDADLKILKFHHSPTRETQQMIDEKSATCIITYRDPVFSINSLIRVFNHSYKTALEEFKKSYDFIIENKNKATIINYREITNSPLLATYRVLYNSFGLQSPWTVQKINKATSRKSMMEKSKIQKNENAEIVDIGFSYYDKKTFLHRNHVSASDDTKPPSLLTENQISEIKSLFNNKL